MPRDAGGLVVHGVIQARMASTRLPGKVLAPILGLPMLAVLVRRLGCSRSVAAWWLATSTEPSDDVLAAWGDELGLRVLRGPEDDVLARVAMVAELATDADWLVRVTADDPFMDGCAIDAGVAALTEVDDDVDLVADPDGRTTALGYLPQLLRRQAVLRAAADVPAGSFHRVHAGTTWLHEQGRSEPWPAAVPAAASRPGWRLTVDTADDLDMARAAFAALGDGWPTATWPDLVRVLDAHPEIVALNAGVTQKAPEDG